MAFVVAAAAAKKHSEWEVLFAFLPRISFFFARLTKNHKERKAEKRDKILIN